MTTITIKKRYIGNGTTEPRREASFKLQVVRCDDKQCGRNWGLVYEDGYELNLHYAVGKNGYKKSEIAIKTEQGALTTKGIK